MAVIHDDVTYKVSIPNRLGTYIVDLHSSLNMEALKRGEYYTNMAGGTNYTRALIETPNSVDHTYARFREEKLDLNLKCLIKLMYEINEKYVYSGYHLK